MPKLSSDLQLSIWELRGKLRDVADISKPTFHCLLIKHVQDIILKVLKQFKTHLNL